MREMELMGLESESVGRQHVHDYRYLNHQFTDCH